MKENLMFKKVCIQILCLIILLSGLIFANKKEDYSVNAEEISFSEKVLANLKDGQQITEQQRDECEQVVKFINSEIDTLTNQYELYSGQKFYGKSIEGWAVTYVIGQDNLATYIDFNEDNGYMVISSDLQLYLFEPYGDLQYLKDKEYVYFNEYSGFVYYDSAERSLVPYETETEKNEEDNYPQLYAGQYKAGDGYINNIGAYVADRYPDYEYVSSYSISNYEHICQLDTSIYLSSTAEGNCAMNALYSVLNSWKMQGLCPNFPSSSSVVRYDPAAMEPNHMQTLLAGWRINDHTNLYSNSAKRINGTAAIDNMPELYISIRQNVYKYHFDYDPTVGGLAIGHAIAALYYTAYDYSTSLVVTNYGDQFNLMEFAFSRNQAAQYLYIQNSSSYIHHCVACYGYRKYKYETGWWIFKSTHYAYFLLIDDGHSYEQYNRGESIYYDPNGVSNSKEQIYIYDNINL